MHFSRLSIFIAATLATCGFAPLLHSEELKMVSWRGHDALLLTGEITEGSARRFELMLPKCPRHRMAAEQEGAQDRCGQADGR